jgi:hypothetical protein
VKTKKKCQPNKKYLLLIKEKLKQLDPTLRIMFIPKTLYELSFIQASIQEDLEDKKTCEYGHLFCEEEISPETEKYKKCWHLCVFEKDKECDNSRASIKELAFRLNQKIFNTSHKGNRTYQEHEKSLGNFVQFLKDCK